MKSFIALPFLAAAAMAAPSYPGAYGGAYGGAVAYGGAAYAPGYGVPAATYPAGAKGLVTYPNGAVVPVEPLGVQAARADHFAAKASAAAAAYAYPAYGYGH